MFQVHYKVTYRWLFDREALTVKGAACGSDGDAQVRGQPLVRRLHLRRVAAGGRVVNMLNSLHSSMIWAQLNALRRHRRKLCHRRRRSAVAVAEEPSQLSMMTRRLPLQR